MFQASQRSQVNKTKIYHKQLRMLDLAIVRKSKREELDDEAATVQIENKQTNLGLEYNFHTLVQ